MLYLQFIVHLTWASCACNYRCLQLEIAISRVSYCNQLSVLLFSKYSVINIWNNWDPNTRQILTNTHLAFTVIADKLTVIDLYMAVDDLIVRQEHLKYLVSRGRNLAGTVALLRVSFAIWSITLKNLEGKRKRNSVVWRKGFLVYDLKLDAVKICERTPHNDHSMY